MYGTYRNEALARLDDVQPPASESKPLDLFAIAAATAGIPYVHVSSSTTYRIK